MSVKQRVEKLEKARPVAKRWRGRAFVVALQRAYGEPDETVEVVSDAEFESALELAYGADYRPPQSR